MKCHCKPEGHLEEVNEKTEKGTEQGKSDENLWSDVWVRFSELVTNEANVHICKYPTEQ